jgi:hypothetical protein
MQGLAYHNENMLPALFEQFKVAHKINTEINRETQHPYNRKFTTKSVTCRGASSLQIEFTDNSAISERDAILFTYDKAGTELVEDLNGASSFTSDQGWAENPKGPDIAFSNGNRSVTRTNSSGWGCALWHETFTTGKYKISIKIDNDGGSDYLYIGLLRASENYPLSDVINSDNSHGVMTWKRTGEFHTSGRGSNSVGNARYSSNDEIHFTIDMDERTMLCNRNGEDVYTFEGIYEECIFACCFGGSNQHFTVTNVEVMGGGSTNVAKKKVSVNSDKVYYHFPVNAGYFS